MTVTRNSCMFSSFVFWQLPAVSEKFAVAEEFAVAEKFAAVAEKFAAAAEKFVVAAEKFAVGVKMDDASRGSRAKSW